MADTTAYEVAIQLEDGTRYQLGYCQRHSARGLLAYMPHVASQLIDMYGGGLTVGKSGGGRNARVTIYRGASDETVAAIMYTGETRRSGGSEIAAWPAAAA